MRTFKMILMFWHVNIWETWMVLFCSETPNLLVLVFSLFDIKSTVFGIFIIWHLIYRFWYFQLFAPLCRYFLASRPPPLPHPRRNRWHRLNFVGSHTLQKLLNFTKHKTHDFPKKSSLKKYIYLMGIFDCQCIKKSCYKISCTISANDLSTFKIYL